MNYATYGPYEIRENSRSAIQELWAEMNQDLEGLPSAIGVYVFVIENTDATLTPVYVGKTIKGFVKRISQHLGQRKFDSAFASEEKLKVFVFPRITPQGKPIKVTESIRDAGGLKSINYLEIELIRQCLRKNPNLRNSHAKRFHNSLHVPGFINSSPEDYDDAASRLAAMLRTN